MNGHILVTRRAEDAHDFIRMDMYNGVWMPSGRGQVLHTILSGINKDIEHHDGDVNITMSSFRTQGEFANPEEASIPDGATVIVLMPIEESRGTGETDKLRLWRAFNWYSPHMEPVKGDKVRQKSLGQWLNAFFTTDQLQAWRLPRSSNKVEIWCRSGWNAQVMFPHMFPVKQKEPPVYTVPGIVHMEPELEVVQIGQDGLPLARVSFKPKSKWKFTGIDGKEVDRGYNSPEEAAQALAEYLSEKMARLPTEDEIIEMQEKATQEA